MARITQYETEEGDIPFERWFSSLGTKAALKVRSAVAQMEFGNLGDHKSVGGGVWERRLHFEKGYRIYFAMDGEELIILFCGGTKTRQQADIRKAKEYWSQYKKRKKQQKLGQQEEDDNEMKARSRKKRRRR